MSLMDNRKCLLHVGLHKCGSTWLQQNMFDNAKIGFVSPWGKLPGIAVTEFVAIDPLAFDGAAVRARLDAAAKLPAGSKNQTLVLSHEALSSRPHHGSYYATEVAARLHKAFPDARVLVIFREQVSLIHSLYGEHLRNGGRLTLREFIGTGNEPPGFTGLCQLTFFCFDRLIEMYRATFGEANVLALPLEMLPTEPTRFVEDICSFGGGTYCELPTAEKVNTAWGPVTYEALRLSNAIVRGNRLRLQAGGIFNARRHALKLIDTLLPRSVQSSIRKKQRAAIERRTAGLFGQSNARLSKMVGLDLREYCYAFSQSS